MTASPVSIRAEPYVQKIVDFSHQYNVEESVVLTRLIDEYSSFLFSVHLITLFDKLSAFLLFLSFITILILLININDDILFQFESVRQRVFGLFFKLILPLLYRGMSLTIVTSIRIYLIKKIFEFYGIY